MRGACNLLGHRSSDPLTPQSFFPFSTPSPPFVCPQTEKKGEKKEEDIETGAVARSRLVMSSPAKTKKKASGKDKEGERRGGGRDWMVQTPKKQDESEEANKLKAYEDIEGHFSFVR